MKRNKSKKHLLFYENEFDKAIDTHSGWPAGEFAGEKKK